MKIYCLKDKACGIVHVFTAANDYAAKRAMTEAMNRGPGELTYRYSDDFDLYTNAEMNADTGMIEKNDLTFVCNLTDLKGKKDE